MARIRNRRAARTSNSGASWISYSDMMAALLLVFVLILSVSLYQYFTMLETKTAELDAQKALVSQQQVTLDAQTLQLASQQVTMDKQATEIAIIQVQLDSQAKELENAYIVLSDQQAQLQQAQTDLADREAKLIILQTDLKNKEMALQAANEVLENQQAAMAAQAEQRRADWHPSAHHYGAILCPVLREPQRNGGSFHRRHCAGQLGALRHGQIRNPCRRQGAA